MRDEQVTATVESTLRRCRVVLSWSVTCSVLGGWGCVSVVAEVLAPPPARPTSNRRIARDTSAARLKGSRLLITPLQPLQLEFVGGIGPGPDVVEVAKMNTRVKAASQALAADFHQRHTAAALALHAEHDFGFRLLALDAVTYQNLIEAPERWLSISIGEELFDVPKRSDLASLVDVNYALAFSHLRFEREDSLVPRGERMMRRQATLLSCRFVLWDYDSGSVVTEGAVAVRVKDQRDIALQSWQELATKTAQDIFLERPFSYD